jgi:hypothetical protein
MSAGTKFPNKLPVAPPNAVFFAKLPTLPDLNNDGAFIAAAIKKGVNHAIITYLRQMF